MNDLLVSPNPNVEQSTCWNYKYRWSKFSPRVNQGPELRIYTSFVINVRGIPVKGLAHVVPQTYILSAT